jgi:hypothetical protein
MSQLKVLSWTNPATAVARNHDCGFTVAEVTTVDVTNGGSWYWNSGMTSGYYLDVDAGTITTSNGFTPLNQGAIYGAAVSGFTSANPGVITAVNVAQVGIVAGDTIQVSNVAESGSATSKNGEFTVASVTATTITLVENTTGYNTYVSGGFVTRVSDSDGNPIATQNVGIRGITAGTGVVGANNAVMVATVKSAESVT